MARDSLSVLAGGRGLERRGGRGGRWPEPNARAAPRDWSCTKEVSEAGAMEPRGRRFVPLLGKGLERALGDSVWGCRAGRQRRQLSDPGSSRVRRGLPSG